MFKNDDRVIKTTYSEWEISNASVIAYVIKPNYSLYEHYCPISHFHIIAQAIISLLDFNDTVDAKLISSHLTGAEFAPGRQYKGLKEEYKVRLVLGVLELEGFIVWAGTNKPIKYRLLKNKNALKKWLSKAIRVK